MSQSTDTFLGLAFYGNNIEVPLTLARFRIDANTVTGTKEVLFSSMLKGTQRERKTMQLSV